jgi:uncharacterized membrane protein YeaQ/YmgE (transglycosylase-associated protein family)
MEILAWIVIGLVAGSVAKLAMDGPDAGGLAVALPLGIGGALVGGLVGSNLLDETAAGFDVRGLLPAMVGTLVVLFCYRALALRSSDERR